MTRSMKWMAFASALRLQILFFRRRSIFLVLVFPAAAIFSVVGFSYVLGNGKIDWREFRVIASVLTYVLCGFGFIMSFSMGAGSISRELEARSAKMILTRPVSFHAWVLSKFLGGMIILTGAIMANAMALIVLYSCVGMPLSLDYCFIIISLFLFSFLSIYAYTFFLSTMSFAGLAAAIAVFLNGPLIKLFTTIFFGIKESLVRAHISSTPIEILIGLTKALYVVIPDTFQSLPLIFSAGQNNFLSDNSSRIAWAMAYQLDLIVIFYLLSYIVLRRKNLQ